MGISCFNAIGNQTPGYCLSSEGAFLSSCVGTYAHAKQLEYFIGLHVLWLAGLAFHDESAHSYPCPNDRLTSRKVLLLTTLSAMSTSAIWQSAQFFKAYDWIIVEQENRLLVNYLDVYAQS